MDWKKRLKYGSYAVITTLVVFAIFVVVNLIAGSQNWKIDLTTNKIYSLSDYTKEVLSRLEQDVEVYVFYKKGEEDPKVNQLLENYKRENPRISIQYLDADINPQKVRQFGVKSYNAVVIKSEKREKIIDSYELYSYGMGGEPEFIGEQKYTNAIKYVTSEKVPTVYFLQGHREPGTESLGVLNEILKMENYKVNTLDLLTQKTIPEDADIIMVISPQSPFLPEETRELERFFAEGGKGMFFIDPPGDERQDISGIKTILGKWGIGINDDVVVEGDESFYYQNPTLLIPEMQGHEVMNQLKENNLGALMGYTRSLRLGGQDGYDVQPLLKSSPNSWGKINIEETLNKEEGDLEGPLTLAAAAKKIEGEDGEEMKAVVFGASSLASDQILQLGRGNKDLLLNAAGWLMGTPEEITIRPKQILNAPLTISRNQMLTYSGLVLLVIPGAVLGSGLVIWSRRRRL